MNKPLARPPLKVPGAKSPARTFPAVAPHPAATEESVPTYAAYLSAMGWAVMVVALLAAIFFRCYYGTSVDSVSRDTSAVLWYLTAVSVVLHFPATLYMLATKRKHSSTEKKR